MAKTHSKFMSFINTNDQNSTLKESLFKGRSDWYFCFLKLEKVAQVCVVLAGRTDTGAKDMSGLNALCRLVVTLPASVLYFAAGERPVATVLADIFVSIFEIHLGVTRGLITKENGAILAQECEMVAEKLHNSTRPSLPLSLDDFLINGISAELTGVSPMNASGVRGIKDIYQIKKSLIKDKLTVPQSILAKSQTDRTSKIVEFVNKNNPVSIKDITTFVHDCSEKTIQRELNVLIGRGVLQRTGERRWSQYSPAQ